MSPYRHMEKRTVKKLPRIRARLRGLYRRVILPAKVIGGMLVFAIIGIEGAYASSKSDLEEKRLRQETHYHDWEAEIAKRQADLDTKVKEFNASLEPKRHEINLAEEKARILQGELEMKLREADYHRELQVPTVIRGTLTPGSNDFHGIHIELPSEPITCYVDRGEGNKPKVTCVKIKN